MSHSEPVSHADLESRLAAAVKSMPMRHSAADGVGRRLGISATEAGLHPLRARRRSFAEAHSATSASLLVSRLPEPGESMHLLMDGSFRLGLVLPVIQRLIGGPCRLSVCTLGLHHNTTNLLHGMLQDGRLCHLRIALSSYFRAGDREIADRAAKILSQAGAAIAVERLHVNLQLWQPEAGSDRYVVESSGNLRSCQCIEIATVINDAPLFEWHSRWLSKLFA